MNRLLTSLLVLLLPAVPLGTGPVHAPAKPNFLIVLLDDTNYDTIQQLDTPQIDFLAANGLSYEHGYAMPKCEMYRYAALFGFWRGIINGGSGAASCLNNPSVATPSQALTSLPELVRDAGYATAAFGKWHLGTNTEGNYLRSASIHGFDTQRAAFTTNLPNCGSKGYWDWQRIDDGVEARSTQYQTTAMRDALFHWWSEETRPRFAYFSLQAPHHPFHQPPPDLVLPQYRRDPTTSTLREDYEAMVSSCDTILGDILDFLSETGEIQNTWIILTADNGPNNAVARPNEVGRVKETVFEPGNKVPFLIAGPGITHPGHRQALASVVDLYPTIAELAGSDALGQTTKQLHGVSLVPTFSSPTAQVRDHVFFAYDSAVGLSGRLNRLYLRGLVGIPAHGERGPVNELWKLHRNTDLRGVNVEVLYNLTQDPRERNPLDVTEHPEILEWLRQRSLQYELDPARSRNPTKT